MSRLRPLQLLALASVPALIGAAVAARADLEVTLRNGDRVRGTIFPASEQETFAFELPRDARDYVVVVNHDPLPHVSAARR